MRWRTNPKKTAAWMVTRTRMLIMGRTGTLRRTDAAVPATAKGSRAHYMSNPLKAAHRGRPSVSVRRMARNG